MELSRLGDVSTLVQDILGFLNFSSGASDPRFLKNLAELFDRIEAARPQDELAWKALGQVLRDALRTLHGASDAFRQVDQVEAVLALVFDAALPAYREFHRDLLYHQTEASLFQPFFIGRMCEAVLQQGGPWTETDRIVQGAVRQLNDYIGHRPVAVLRTEQKIQPYPHEWVRPIPLWIRGAGAAPGPYRKLIEAALAILDATDPSILFDAFFAPELLDELAMDPRAYDFDHPVNKRPNYLFGQWDMGQLDNAGRCRRFVLQQASLNAMLDRLRHRGRLSPEQALFEEAAVLAGTMLMGSGTSGNRPDAHDSNVTLATLVGKIAVYRDAFYDNLLRKMTGPHAKRLRSEAAALHQPFGGARQHFNHFLANQRALQLLHVHVAQVYAAMGRTEAAEREASLTPAASARMICQMRCRLSAAHLAMDRGRLAEAADELPRIEDLLHRAIECGAMVDPWNILGFGGQYSLFPAVENSIPDHRVDDLLDMIADVFALYERIVKAAAAGGDAALQQTLFERLAALARWWDRHAAVEVDSVEGLSGQETLDSAQHVAAALAAWHQGGAEAGDLAFWRRHVGEFRSPKAYALVIETLLDRRDPVAAMALLVQWLSQASDIPLVEEDYSFHDLALLWMEDLWRSDDAAASWPLARKFLDYLEANAEDYWRVPRFELSADALDGVRPPEGDDSDLDSEEEDEDDDGFDLFGAAYEGVSYRDSADDGVEGEMFESGRDDADFELVGEGDRIVDRLNFLCTLAQLWKLCATASLPRDAADRDEVLSGWLAQALENRRRLNELLIAVHRYRIPPPRGTQESLIEYDRRRGMKDNLLEEIIETHVETDDAVRILRAAMVHPPEVSDAAPWERQIQSLLASALRGDAAGVRRAWPKLLPRLVRQPLLYVALARGGNPQRIAASRSLQLVLRRLLTYLPRLGLLAETCQLLETVQRMESSHPVGAGAITEFDRAFDTACKSMTRCLIAAADDAADAQLIDDLEQLTEALLRCWLAHSRGVRLSVLETVGEPGRWRRLVQFIQRYGADLFTQQFMYMGNLRGILHQGVLEHLTNLAENPDFEEEFRLLGDLNVAIPIEEAAHWLSIVIEAVVENYGEYVDYNSITTQSDRGDMLYTLLDFLRLRASYDRLAWNLRPVELVHEVLVRSGRPSAAEVWRTAVADRTAPIAEEHLKRFERLCKKYGMRLPSLAEHFSGRFIRPLEIDQLCALVRPAVDEIRQDRKPRAFEELEQHIARFSKAPAGAGYELPSWLDALEREMDRFAWQPESEQSDEEVLDPLVRIEQVKLSREQLRRQLRRMLGQGPSGLSFALDADPPAG